VDTGSWTKGLPQLGLNVGITLLTAGSGKVLGGLLSASSAREAEQAWSLISGWRALPYLSEGGAHSAGAFDWVGTSMVLGVNVGHGVAQCFASFSAPC
jgi:hypothetical protein